MTNLSFTIDRDVFKAGVATASRVTNSRGSLPVLANVHLEGIGNSLLVTATNLEISIKCRLDAQVSVPGATTVPAALLKQLISSLSGSEVSAELTNRTEILMLQCGATKARIKGIAANEFPVMVVQEGREIVLDAPVLREMISQVVYATEQGHARPVLTGVLVEVGPEGLTMVAADGYRLARRSLAVTPAPQFEASVIVPALAMREALGALSGVEGQAAIRFAGEGEQAHVCFATPNTDIVTQLINGTFPDYRQIIPAEREVWATVDTTALAASVGTAALFSQAVRLDFAQDVLIISATSAELGSCEDEVSCSLAGEPRSITLNSKFLLETLNTMPWRDTLIGVSAPSAPLLIKPGDDTDLVSVLMPLHMQERG